MPKDDVSIFNLMELKTQSPHEKIVKKIKKLNLTTFSDMRF